MKTSSKTETKAHSPGGLNFRAVSAGIILGDTVWTVDLALKHPSILKATAPMRSGTVYIGVQCCVHACRVGGVSPNLLTEAVSVTFL